MVVDGTRDRELRSDIILYRGDQPLAVLELKRPGIALGAEDEAQGLSYARVLFPSPPLVIVTNGKETRLLVTHTGMPLEADHASQTTFAAVVGAAAQAAGGSLKAAIQTLMGSDPHVWRQAVEQATDAKLAELSPTPDMPTLPFGLLLPRKATAEVIAVLRAGHRLVLVEGAPIIGKSNVLREFALGTRANDDFVTLFLESGGSGIVQTFADALSSRLDWPVTLEEARSWLLRQSRSGGPALVLALDGYDAECREVRHEIEDLTSPAFGDGLRVIVAIDDAAAERFVMAANGRSPSAIGRRSRRVALGPMDDDEFDVAQEVLWSKRIAIMPGGRLAREMRLPWVIQTLCLDFARAPEHIDQGLAAYLPPLLSLELIAHARERFADPELRRLTREVARAVLADARDRRRAVPLTLEALGVYIVRRRTIADRLDRSEISGLVDRGYLKPAIHPSGEPILACRLPEMVASELAEFLAAELAPMSRADPEAAAAWLAEVAASLPLGDIVCGQAILDAALHHGGISAELFAALIASVPQEEAIRPGARLATHLPGVGLVDLTVLEDGSMVAKVNGHRHLIEAGEDGGAGTTYSNIQSWLILSHVAGHAFVVETADTTERIDPIVLMEVGTAPLVLRQPSPEMDLNGIPTHDIPGIGSVACHVAGIIEPITYSILLYILREGRGASEWISAACDRGSLPLLARVDIALRRVAEMADTDLSTWARELLAGMVRAAFAGHPLLHPD